MEGTTTRQREQQRARSARCCVPNGTGSWTSEDEVQVTEDAPRPASSQGALAGSSIERRKQLTLSVSSRAGLFLRVAHSVFVGVEIKRLKGIWWMPWH
ncbi:protein of unknown function (plasmid) [Azospirillum lipoferum 4B]|uniref:Uncharacterized protein n=1 Tax=Azospirillum lipoferum (strain 4B) TaxID=862719 RepID=G7Z9W7_AZOL4|nr:protein of unknown function [Azospirillum lipoferum 4B]